MRKFFVLGAAAAMSIACGAEPDADEPETLDAEVNAARECNPLPDRSTPLATPIEGLAAMPSIPLPARGPDAAGYFHPPKGYTEGGTFAAPADRAAWKVDAREIAPKAPPGTLRVAEWNIARGNKLDAAVRLMKKINADVWMINESDLYGKNSGGVVVAREAARALGYSYYTGIEFYERRDDRRGTSGNAILSRYPLSEARSIDVPMFTEKGGSDWSTNSSEPRCGQRNSLAAAIEAPTASGGVRRIKLVVLHTENKANPAVRRLQFESSVRDLVVPGEPAIVAGDLNNISAGEGADVRRDLAAKTAQLGRARSLFDCSRGDDTTTFSAALVVRMRIDWMLVQSGDTEPLDCAPRSYRVAGNDGASDHKPVVTEMTVR